MATLNAGSSATVSLDAEQTLYISGSAEVFGVGAAQLISGEGRIGPYGIATTVTIRAISTCSYYENYTEESFQPELIISDDGNSVLGIKNPDGTDMFFGSGGTYTPNVTDEQKAGTVDATQALIDTAAAITAAGGGTLFIDGTLLCNSSISLPVNVNIVFNPGAKILTRAGGTFTGDAVFLINCSNGTSWDVAYPNIRGYAVGVYVDNSANPAVVVGAMKLGAAIQIINIHAQHCHFTVKTTSNYLDLLRIDGAMHAEPQGSGYPIELTNLGDGLSIRSSHAYLTGGQPNNIKITACQGGEIQGTIGGNLYINQCRAVKVHGCHHETGQILVDGSDVSIEDVYFWIRDVPGIKLIASSGGNRRNVSIRNVTFVFRKAALGYTPTTYDIQVAPWYDVAIDNVSRAWGNSANAYDSEKFGVFIQKGDNSALTAWNKYAYQLSHRGRIGYGELVTDSIDVNPGSGACSLIVSVAASSEATFQAATATYYYQAQLVYDAGRQLGQNSSSGEFNIALTNGGDVAQFVVGSGFAARTQDAFYRLYRGTSTGSYNFYVDIPLSAARSITDRGDYCSGFAWIARGAAAVTSMQDIDDLTINGGNVVATLSTTPPTVGTWVVKDRCYNRTPTAGGFIGTVCTAAGSPGTHKTWGAITP